MVVVVVVMVVVDMFFDAFVSPHLPFIRHRLARAASCAPPIVYSVAVAVVAGY